MIGWAFLSWAVLDFGTVGQPTFVKVKAEG
jgi:hypothetical protein